MQKHWDIDSFITLYGTIVFVVFFSLKLKAAASIYLLQDFITARRSGTQDTLTALLLGFKNAEYFEILILRVTPQREKAFVDKHTFRFMLKNQTDCFLLLL